MILFSWQYISAKVQCSAWFWSVEDLAEGRTDCGEVARGGCLVARNFIDKLQLYLRQGREWLHQTRHDAVSVTGHYPVVWKFHRLQTTHCTIIGRNVH
jgi:hypothetical protein